MKVYIERTDVIGEVIVHTNVKKVTDKGTAYELYINKNWQIIASKENHRLFKVEEDGK